jgi:16S rRNA (cytosine1402-N4)-methyltransferase
LDLRFDPSTGEPAWRMINRLSAEHLADLIYQYGEERYSRRIARAIVERRRDQPIRTAGELAELVQRMVPRTRPPQRIDPATRTFQALRIAVNDELKSLEIALRRLPECLRPGGRLAVISFHSLEDRRVKEAFRDDPRYRPLTRKPVVPGEEESNRNPRSRSAKLRVAELNSAV